MLILSLEDVKTSLICLEGNTKLSPWSKHHLGAIHEIIYHILQKWLICFPVDSVEENLIICNDLNSRCASDIVDLTS